MIPTTVKINILLEMLKNADRPNPWKPSEFVKDKQSLSSVYIAIIALNRAGLVNKVTGGIVLSKLILDAGARFHAGIAKATVNNNLENLYGKQK